MRALERFAAASTVDILHGGPGNDVLSIGDDYWPDVVDGAGGFDTLNIFARNNAIALDLRDPTAPAFLQVHEIYTDRLLDTVRVLHIEQLNVSSDWNEGNDTIFAAAGNDTLVTGDGSDFVDGGAGNDLIASFTDQFGSGWDDFYGGLGNDTLDSASGYLDGGPGDDLIKIPASGGGASAAGGEGHDLFELGREYYDHWGSGWYVAGGAQTITDFQAGNDGDTLALGGDVRFVETGQGLRVDTWYNAYSGQGYHVLYWAPLAYLQGADAADLTAFNFTDLPISSVPAPQGTGAADTIAGSAIGDSINGGSGDDGINGWMGADTLNGGPGNDALFGNSDADLLNGGPGNDTLQGGPDNSELYGAIPGDTLNGGDGNDSLDGDWGSDRLNGGAGDDVLRGGPDTDFHTFAADNDTLLGDAGNDTIYGGSGIDFIRGGTGDDVLYGGMVSDADPSGDVFFFGASDSGNDRIEDFYGDIVDLNGLGIHNTAQAMPYMHQNAAGEAVFVKGALTITFTGLGIADLGDFVA